MKTNTTLFALPFIAMFSFCIAIQSPAQVVMYGLLSDGGANGAGVIFSVTPSGTLDTIASLNPTYAAHPDGSLLYASDGNFYASSLNGGYADSCTIFRSTPNGTLKTIINLDTVWGPTSPEGNSLIEGFDGNLYFMTTYGGQNHGNPGIIFKLDLSGHYSALHFFNDTDGATPYGSLIQTADSNLWGMTSAGGTDNVGTIFHCTTSGVFTSVFSFNDSTGTYPYGDLLLANDGNFYGLTSAGGRYGYGTLFRYTPAGAFTKLVDFNGTNGAKPYGSLIQASDGKLYGMTSAGGDSVGTLFVCTLSGNLTTLVNFNDSNGATPMGTLIQASDGNLYGMTEAGGPYISGVIFQYSLAGNFKKIDNFGVMGANPMYGKLIEVDHLQGIKEVKTNSEEVSVYPNPNNGIFQLGFRQQLSANSYIEVYNMLGEKVYSQYQLINASNYQIDLSSQPNGVYFYSVRTAAGDMIGSGKLVIAK